MIATRVYLSSGDSFYVDADKDEVVGVLGAGRVVLSSARLVAVGGRYVNPLQVTQILSEEMSTIHVAERLATEDDTPNRKE